MSFKTLVMRMAEYFSRKFVLAASSLVAGTWITLKGMDVLGFSALVGVVLASYNGANVAETYALVKSKINARSTEIEAGSGAKVTVDVEAGT